MAADQLRGRPAPHLSTRRQLTLRRQADNRQTAPLACLLVLVSASVVVCSPQLNSAVLADHAHQQISNGPQLSTGPSWGGQFSRSMSSEQMARQSRRLMLAPDVQTAQQAAQQAVNRCSVTIH